LYGILFTMPSFTVTVGSVHGPLEVVLELVEKRKLFVNDVALAAITDEYVAFVQNSTTSLEDRAGFMGIASSLLLIKARSLLPSFAFTASEEAQVSTLRRDLVRYAFFRTVARRLEKVYTSTYVPEQKRDGRRTLRSTSAPTYNPGVDCTTERLCYTMRTLLASVPYLQHLHTTTVKSIQSIEQVVVELITRVSRAARTSFNEATHARGREEVIVYFLAMLELVKRGVIDAQQHGTSHSDDILLSKVTSSVMHIS
jgi:segregation and condensation protein A